MRYRRMSRLERLLQKWQARFAAYDLERLVDVGLVGVIIVWFFLVVFVPAIGR